MYLRKVYTTSSAIFKATSVGGVKKKKKRKRKNSRRKKKDLIELRGTLGGLNSLDSHCGPAEKERLLVV